MPSGLDMDDEPGSFIKENRFATAATPAPILRKTWSKGGSGGKRSLVEKPLLHRMPVDLDTDHSGSTMTMNRSGVSGLSSALSNSRDHVDVIEMVPLQVGRLGGGQRPVRVGRPDQRPAARRRTQDAPTPDLILNGMLGAGQAQLASTSSSEGGGRCVIFCLSAAVVVVGSSYEGERNRRAACSVGSSPADALGTRAAVVLGILY